MTDIKELRKSTGLSQSRFAELTGVPVRTLQRWEQGQNTPPEYVTDMIAKIIGGSSSSERYSLPEQFRPLFDDADFDALDAIRDKNFIICRMYCRGGMKGILWAESTYPEEDIAYAARATRGLSPIVANYLRIKYSLKPSEMMYYNRRLEYVWGK